MYVLLLFFLSRNEDVCRFTTKATSILTWSQLNHWFVRGVDHHSCCHFKDVQLYFHLLHLDFNVMADCCVTQWSVTSLTPLGHSSVIFAVVVLDHSQPRHHRCAFDLICLWSLISQRELQKGFIKFYPPIHPSSIHLLFINSLSLNSYRQHLYVYR